MRGVDRYYVDEFTRLLHRQADEQPWRRQALCLSADPELFYPRKGAVDEHEAAKALCDRCPVRLLCLEHALAVGETDGIWGGLSGRERRRLRRERSA